MAIGRCCDEKTVWGKSQKKVNKKGKGKKVVDTMARKEWYDVRAPNQFKERNVCKTLVNRTAGLRIASDSLKGRVFEANLGDLNKNEDQGFRKMKLRVEDVQGDKCITLFYGMDITRDKLCSMIKKWKTLIEANVEVTTTDGYKLRVFCIAFTRKQENQNKKTCYAQSSQIHAIRAKMVEIITEEVSKSDLASLVNKFCAELIGARIQKECTRIYPIENTMIRKVKMLKAPKVELAKLMEQHTEVVKKEEEGAKVEEPKECTRIYPIENTMIRKVKMLKAPKVELAKLMEQHTEVVKKEEEGAKVEEPVAPLAGNGGRL
ncbi:ribosomal protein S3a [Blastocystis sp. ATCC 50177/Nand II]|uniref:Small ribosomal subunit protein eS1 n=2 Tax=Blastocystis sp. subtype 1 (strain ATCC 50177 / NandII) TaxID=478820 RepID=A0A196S5C3_BLAHN|nr:ribosomal protein S3a [Blastocystis sp. ATCC 50177/Nand II]